MSWWPYWRIALLEYLVRLYIYIFWSKLVQLQLLLIGAVKHSDFNSRASSIVVSRLRAREEATMRANACHLSTHLLLIFILVLLILATSCCTSAYGRPPSGSTDPVGGTRGPSCCNIPGCC